MNRYFYYEPSEDRAKFFDHDKSRRQKPRVLSAAIDGDPFVYCIKSDQPLAESPGRILMAMEGNRTATDLVVARPVSVSSSLTAAGYAFLKAAGLDDTALNEDQKTDRLLGYVEAGNYNLLIGAMPKIRDLAL